MVWYCVTTDQGSNEANARKLIQVATESLEQVIFLDCNCLEHQAHLGVHAALVYLDEALKEHQRSFRYYSSLAIFSSVVRDLSRDMFQKWEEFFGSESAMDVVRTLVPKSSAGRWGCLHEIEERFLKAPQAMWAQCLNYVILEKLQLDSAEINSLQHILPNDVHRIFSSKAPKKKSAAKKPATATAGATTGNTKQQQARDTMELTSDGKVDLLSVETMAEHAKRIGRWRRHLLLTINDKLFGALVDITHMSRCPIIHLSHFLKQNMSMEEVANKGNKLHQLVCFKAAELREEFEELLCTLV